MKPDKGYYFEIKTIVEVDITVERHKESKEISRAFIGEVDVTELLDYVQSSDDIFEELSHSDGEQYYEKGEPDADAIYEERAWNRAFNE